MFVYTVPTCSDDMNSRWKLSGSTGRACELLKDLELSEWFHAHKIFIQGIIHLRTSAIVYEELLREDPEEQIQEEEILLVSE